MSDLNLYSQDDFPQAEQALIFHLGLGLFMAEWSRAELPEGDEEQVSGSWRRFKQALADLNDAGESEDYQAVGIKCRDALLATVRDHMTADWVGEVETHPRSATSRGGVASSPSVWPKAGCGRTSRRLSSAPGT